MAEQNARARKTTEKSDRAFRTISEVSAELDLPQHVLRFWETRFTQIKPMKRNGGRRLYRPDHIALLRGIKALLYDDGLTIKGVQKVLREKGTKAVAARGAAPADGRGDWQMAEVPGDVTEKLSALRERLESHMGKGEAGEQPDRADFDEAEISRMRDSIARLEALLVQLEQR